MCGLPLTIYFLSDALALLPSCCTQKDGACAKSIGWSGPEYAVVRTRDGTPPTAEMLREAASGLNLSSSGIVDMSADNSTMDSFRLALEEGLNRPILDDTNMKGAYDIAVHGARSTEEFVQMLCDQTGIALTPARRNIEILVVRPLR